MNPITAKLILYHRASMLETNLKYKRPGDQMSLNNPFLREPNLPEEKFKPLSDFCLKLLRELVDDHKVPLEETINVVKYTNIPQTKEQEEYFIRFFTDMLKPMWPDCNANEDPN